MEAPTIASVTVENLRGFRRATLPLLPRMVLVGPNNSGKTSICRLLKFVLDGSEDALRGFRSIDEQETALLLPARTSQGTARRITLRVQLHDARRFARFSCDADGFATLRVSLRADRLRLNVGQPRQAEGEDDAAAVQLLYELREAYTCLWIPAARDATSSDFAQQLYEAVLSWHRELRTGKQGGTTKVYRATKAALDAANEVFELVTERFVSAVGDAGVPGVSQALQSSPRITIDGITDWFSRETKLRLATGEHDSRGVPPEEVGSGLQSLILLALLQRSGKARTGQLLLMVEEPESNLHPSVQRRLARQLLSPGGPGDVVLLSTHSSQVVSEAGYGQTILVAGHRFYPPSEGDDAVRASINSVLMEDRAAETFFAKSVLLVEGPGDRRFFEAIRRRIASSDDTGVADQLFVNDVGGNTRFGPWIRLLRSYGEEGDRPIEWLILTDGDSPRELRQGLRDGGLSVPSVANDSLNALRRLGWSEIRQRRTVAQRANQALRASGLRSMILSLDFEWALFGSLSPRGVRKAVNEFNVVATTAEELAQKMGSKFGTGVSNGRKDPWARGEIGRWIPWRDLSDELRSVLIRWLVAGGLTRAEARRLLSTL